MITATSATNTSFAQSAQETSPNRESTTAAGSAVDQRDNVAISKEARLLAQLKSRDREVRAHEAAHQAAAGGLVQGAPSYTFQSGPDGRRYAIGGEVSIDISPGSTPEETLVKARQIRAAALAPAEPSSQDFQVAAKAAAMAQEARIEISTRQAASYSAETTNGTGAAIDVFA